MSEKVTHGRHTYNIMTLENALLAYGVPFDALHAIAAGPFLEGEATGEDVRRVLTTEVAVPDIHRPFLVNRRGDFFVVAGGGVVLTDWNQVGRSGPNRTPYLLGCSYALVIVPDGAGNRLTLKSLG